MVFWRFVVRTKNKKRVPPSLVTVLLFFTQKRLWERVCCMFLFFLFFRPLIGFSASASIFSTPSKFFPLTKQCKVPPINQKEFSFVHRL